MESVFLYIGDDLVDLKDSTKVAFTIKDIDIGNIQNRYSNVSSTIKALNTENNAAIFGLSDNQHSESSYPYLLSGARLILNGSEIKGVVSIQRFVNNSYELYFVDSAFEFFSLVKGVSLSTVAPITDSAWTEEEIDSNRATTSGLISAVVWWGTGTDIFISNLFLPSFFYHTLVTKVFEYMGVTPSGDILTDSRFKDLIVPFPGNSFTWLNAVDAPTFIAKGSSGATTGSSFNFSYPNDVQEYDILFLHVFDYGLGTVTVDASWTTLGSLAYPTGTPVMVSKLYYKIADGTETGTEAVSRSGHAGTDAFMGQVYQYRGDQYHGDYNITVEDSDDRSGNTATITWDALGLSGGKRTLLAFVANYNGSAPATPSGYTESATDNNGSNTYLDLNTKADDSSGSSATASGGSTNGWITWHVAIYNARQNVNWNQYLSEIKADELLKDFFNRFALKYKYVNGTLYLKGIEDIIKERYNAVDWSSKLVKTEPEIDFTIKSGWAQNTLFKYTTGEFVSESLGDGTITVANENLPTEKVKFTSLFENSNTLNTTGHLVARIPVFESTSETSSDFVNEPGIKLLTIKSRTSEPSITFDQTVRTDYKLGYFVDGALAKDTGWQYFLDQFYPSLSVYLQKSKVLTKYYNLTASDISGYDPFKLVYDGEGYYLVNTISNFVSGRITKVELFKVG